MSNKWFYLKHSGTDRISRQYDLRRRKLKGIVENWIRENGIGDRIVKGAIKARFDSEGSASSSWAELAKSTQRDRTAKGFSPKHPILIRTGDLLGEATGKKHKMPNVSAGNGTITAIYEVKSEKALSHLRGENEEGRSIPVRHFMNMSKTEVKKMHDSARHEIGTKLLKIRL